MSLLPPATQPPGAVCAPGVRSRVGLALAGVLMLVVLIAASWWLHETRRAIGEEVEAASRVAEQWLNVLVAETLHDRVDGPQRLMTRLRAVGRLRANRLEVWGADGERLYVSPEPVYKAHRFAPEWFAAQVAPAVVVRHFDAGDRQLVLRPDTSRAVLDAWDDLMAGLGWAGAALLLLGLAARAAFDHALAPLRQIDAALSRGADGRFDRRLPGYRVAALDRLAATYNRLAERLDRSEARNLQLERDQDFARALQARLVEERRAIARELHDELGQAITAVRAISGAILQRTTEQPLLHGSAQAILAMTGQMQDGVRAILQRLRPAACEAALDEAVRNYCAAWSSHHPQVSIECRAEALPPFTAEATTVAVLRVLQESLTNVARHAAASRVEVRLDGDAEGLELCVTDNGRGLARPIPAQRCGIAGMRERVVGLRGELLLETPPGGGLRVRAWLPLEPADGGAPPGPGCAQPAPVGVKPSWDGPATT